MCSPGRSGRIGRTPYAGAHEIVLERPERRRRPAANAGLLIDVLDVMADGLGRDAEVSGDLLVRLAAHEHEQHFQLALGQPCRQLPRSLRHTVAGRRQHRVDDLPVEPTLVGFPQQLDLGGLGAESRPVGPRFAHGAIAVGGRENAGRPIECRAVRAPVIAGAVEPLVV